MSQPSSIVGILREPTRTTESTESSALIVGAIAFVVAAPLGLLLFWGRDLAISGPDSLGMFIALGSALVALLAFVAGRLLLRRRFGPAPDDPDVEDAAATRSATGPRGAEAPRLHWFDVVALSVAHGVIAMLGWVALADVLDESFVDAPVYALPAALLFGVALALTAYVCFLSAVRMTPMLLSIVLAVFLVFGVLTAMLSSTDPHWWQMNLSALGMTDDVSALAFNLTLVVAGAIVTIVARYATAGLPVTTEKDRRGRDFVRYGLVLIGILLACVGIFPVDEFFLLHNTVASGMAVVYAVIVIGLPRFLPSMPRVFVILGWVYVGVIVVLGVFFATGYYNLTAVELVAGLLIFSWIILFLRNSGSVGARRVVAVTA
ncbi:ABC transporter permease [Agromyces luteolus]|uniref:DUF998 domain-containing protein n=1 Tax=Agromyces luteolus TaxID=88373 RepID=A0A7C9LCT2_9MICO|nr:hypothetical protein [Agromyces luteolus]MUN06351.1 hypothetical protein [Agromyces luteolus]GLK26616.1 ABC transporter permease [Agromyces luteolus]